MPRARFLRPEFFTDEKIGELPFGARLLFTAIWCQSDLRGVFEHSAKLLRVQAFPFDEGLTSAQIAEWLGLLASKGFVASFEADGKTWGHVVNWLKHADIQTREVEIGSHRPVPPGWVDPPKWQEAVENGRKQGRVGDRTAWNHSRTIPERFQNHTSTDTATETSTATATCDSGRAREDIASPPLRVVASDSREVWRYEQLEPYAKAIIAANGKIGAQSFPAWKAMVEKHGLEVVVATAKSVPADDRFSGVVEQAIDKNHGRAPTQHRRITKVTL